MQTIDFNKRGSLLTYAEAQNEASGPDQSVYDAINQLRRRPDINMPEVPKGIVTSSS